MSWPHPTRFVILSTQRSGSNWLEDRLDGHPDVHIYRSEVFRRATPAPGSYPDYCDSSTVRRMVSRIMPPAAKFNYLRTVWSPTAQDATAVGFRLMYDQLRRNPSLGVLLPSHRVRVVHLVRQNLLATLISSRAAKETGIYITRSAARRADPVTLDVAALIPELERRQRSQDFHRKQLALMSSIEISYEDYIARPGENDRALLEFLGLRARDLASGLERTSVPTLEGRVANYAEVAAHLGQTRWAVFLD